MDELLFWVSHVIRRPSHWYLPRGTTQPNSLPCPSFKPSLNFKGHQQSSSHQDNPSTNKITITVSHEKNPIGENWIEWCRARSAIPWAMSCWKASPASCLPPPWWRPVWVEVGMLHVPSCSCLHPPTSYTQGLEEPPPWPPNSAMFDRWLSIWGRQGVLSPDREAAGPHLCLPPLLVLSEGR